MVTYTCTIPITLLLEGPGFKSQLDPEFFSGSFNNDLAVMLVDSVSIIQAITLDYFTCIYSAFRFASWWFYPGDLIKAEFEFNMPCMLYMPCLYSQVIVWV